MAKTNSRPKRKAGAQKKKRTRKPQSEYKKAVTAFRKISGRHVLELEADMQEDDKRWCFREAEDLRKLSNQVKGTFKKRLDQLMRTRQYRRFLKDYAWAKKEADRINEEKDPKAYRAAEKKRRAAAAKLNAMQAEYGITSDAVEEEMRRCVSTQKISSVFLHSACIDIWDSIQSVLYGKGKHLNFRKYNDLPELRATQINRIIRLKFDDNGKPLFFMDGVKPFSAIIKKGDLFPMEELSAVHSYLENPDVIEKNAVDLYEKSGIITDTHRPVYAAICCREIRGRLRVFIHLTIEGQPLHKKDKDGNPRHDFSKTGNVGIDLGTQSVSASSKNGAMLVNLGERHDKSTRVYENKEARLLRAMERSRRETNPDNYYPDGRVKPKKERKPWKYSNNYKKLQYQYHEMARKNAESRKYANREISNKIRAMGDTAVIEPKNAAKLAKKAKKSRQVVKPDGTVHNTKRKRFGKSIHYRCPGQLQAEIEKKFGEDNYHVVPPGYKASQYDHTDQQYKKKGLGDRVFLLSDGTQVQRDMYSAYLMECADGEYQSIDQGKCEKGFQRFLKMQEDVASNILANGLNICNSGIRPGTWGTVQSN